MAFCTFLGNTDVTEILMFTNCPYQNVAPLLNPCKLGNFNNSFLSYLPPSLEWYLKGIDIEGYDTCLYKYIFVFQILYKPSLASIREHLFYT